MLPLRPTIHKMKPYVPGKPVEEVQREMGVTDLVKLNQNENPLGPSPKAVAAAMQAMRQVHTYPEGTARVLREKLAEMWGVPENWIVVGNGSDEIFRLLAETYLNPGDKVVVPTPSFSAYSIVAELMGAEVVAVPLNGATMDLMAMAQAAVEQSAKLIFLCRPNNPTGGVFDEESFWEFMAAAPKNALVILDEAYQEFDETGFNSRNQLAQFPNLVVTRTFSKLYGMAGFRLGYGVAHSAVIAPFFTVRDPFSINNLAIAAGLAALDDEDHIERTRMLNEAGKEYLYGEFQRLGVTYTPTEANFILFETARPATAVFGGLLRRGVLIRPCGSFGLPNSLRVTIGTAAENQRFIAALEEVLK